LTAWDVLSASGFSAAGGLAIILLKTNKRRRKERGKNKVSNKLPTLIYV
jgi:hypothetical protein